MEADLYDEFGNYIGPDLESDSEEEDEMVTRDHETQEYDVSLNY
jgi:U5 small nuclear ribonucleoprotein component